jgi:hypothetical protein
MAIRRSRSASLSPIITAIGMTLPAPAVTTGSGVGELPGVESSDSAATGSTTPQPM